MIHTANSTAQLRVWLLSPYHTGSHASWASGLVQHSAHQIELLTMAGRFWKWRMQGGAMELAAQARQRLADGDVPDAIIATDMVNLPMWLGLLRRELPAQIPVLYYMHENQLTYPPRPGEKPDLTYAMLNWASQLCADQVAFNSGFHRANWFAEVPKLLKHFPDYNHLARIDSVQQKSSVLPVGIAVERIAQRQPQANQRGTNPRGAADFAELPPLIVWNQRWEYDKRPDRFFRLLYRLQEAGVPFRLAVAGENFRNVPHEYEEAQQRLAHQIVHWGYLPSYDAYIELLGRADLVISTAEHEFFGISVVEAMAAGAFPLLPNRLSYPELLPSSIHPACLYADEEELYTKARTRLQSPRPAPPSLQRYVRQQFNWPAVARQYDALLWELVRVPYKW